jgi:CheY-like chemotaxis protein
VGLGLHALSKRLERLGGTWGAAARTDGARGSCFWMSVPFAETEEGREEEESGLCRRRMTLSYQRSMLGRVWSLPNFPPLRVLIVDDSVLYHRINSRLFCRKGYHVEVARHGAECLEILESSRSLTCSANRPEYSFDVVLMDDQMPVMDGLEAARQIRALEIIEKSKQGEESGGNNGSSSQRSPPPSFTPHILIIGTSVQCPVEMREQCLQSGMDGFIEKPLRVETFQELVAAVIVKNGDDHDVVTD